MSDKVNLNMEIWSSCEKPPKEALKQIKGGRMAGMTNINPQWRYKTLTELFGVAGEGWWYEETRRDFVPCGDEIAVFVDIKLFIKGFEHPIHGSGGSMFRTAEQKGLRCNDEAVKMATTDAMSCACKTLGIGSAIYEGSWDGDKYREEAPATTPVKPDPEQKGAKPDGNQKETPKAKMTPADKKWIEITDVCKAKLGDDMYYNILAMHDAKHRTDITNRNTRNAVYKHMIDQIAENAKAQFGAEKE